tara:strand:+ start:50094 stop:50264 length:171 start_codon:yes stop_codon:yes gene_type:complete
MHCGSNVGVELANQHDIQKHKKRLLLMSDLKLLEEIGKRRTFAIISHPDAAQPFNA